MASTRAAIDAIETKVDSFRVGETQTAFVDAKIYPAFRLAIEIAGQEGQAREAFEYAERLRSWTLRRLLGGPRPANGVVASELGAAEVELLAAIHQLEKSGATAEIRQDPVSQGELERLRSQFETRRLERKLAAAEGNSLVPVKAVTLEQLQTQVLDAETTLLVYGAGLEDLWFWVIDRGSIEMVRLPQTADEQKRLIFPEQALRQERRGAQPIPEQNGFTAEESSSVRPLPKTVCSRCTKSGIAWICAPHSWSRYRDARRRSPSRPEVTKSSA